jgi:hypothetical protein
MAELFLLKRCLCCAWLKVASVDGISYSDSGTVTCLSCISYFCRLCLETVQGVGDSGAQYQERGPPSGTCIASIATVACNHLTPPGTVADFAYACRSSKV